jgi:hypothetical protein
MLGSGALGECAIGEAPIVPAPVTSGKLKKQFRQYREEELTTTLTRYEFSQRWRLVLDAVEQAIPGPKSKVHHAMAKYKQLEAENGRSMARRREGQIKAEACAGICTVRALELALAKENAK